MARVLLSRAGVRAGAAPEPFCFIHALSAACFVCVCDLFLSKPRLWLFGRFTDEPAADRPSPAAPYVPRFASCRIQPSSARLLTCTFLLPPGYLPITQEEKKEKKKKKEKEEDLLDEKLWEATAGKAQVSSWADCDTDDDDDFGGGGLAPLPADWKPEEEEHEEEEEEEESEHEEDDMVKDDDDDEEEEEEEEAAKPVPAEVPKAKAAEPERKLSKKELKKKELEDLDAVFAELGVEVQQDSNGSAPAGESKAAMKRRKKAEREAAEAAAAAPPAPEAKAEEADDDSGPIDPAEAKKRLMAKMAGKKKTSTGGAAAAAAEAKARAAKAKKKGQSKANYNQAPA